MFMSKNHYKMEHNLAFQNKTLYEIVFGGFKMLYDMRYEVKKGRTTHYQAFSITK